MTTERKRRLAAVWFADIVGYTRLSASHEDAALTVVEEFQRASREAVAAHGGRVVKFVGDAVLAVSDSADAALEGALALQAAFARAATAARYGCELTIGIHLGEVVEAEDGDVYGDGVNVASRVQGKARPGQILATRSLLDVTRGRAGFHMRQLPPWTRLKGLGFSQLYVVARAGERPPPRRVSRGRAVAMGMTVALVAFIGLVIANGFGNARPEGPEERAPLTAEELLTAGNALDLGVERYFARELDEAIATLGAFTREPLRGAPVAEEALRYLARAHLAMDQTELAKATLEQLVNNEPPMELLIPSVEQDSLVNLYYQVRLDVLRPADSVAVGGLLVFDFLLASDRDDPGLASVGASVTQMLLSELEADVPVRYPWEILLGYSGEVAYRFFDDNVLHEPERPVTHALFGRVLVHEDYLLLAGRVYEIETGAQVVSETVEGVWPDQLFELVDSLGGVLGAQLGALGGEEPNGFAPG